MMVSAKAVVRKRLFIVVAIVLTLIIGYEFLTAVSAFSESLRAYLSDNFLVRVSDGYLKLFVRTNSDVALKLRTVDVRYGSFRCSIRVDLVMSNLSSVYVITINGSGLSLSAINGSQLKYYQLNTTGFLSCLKGLFNSYVKTMVLGLKDLRIYSPLDTHGGSRLVFHDNFTRMLKFLARYPLYEFVDGVFFVWFRVDPYVGYLSGNYNLNIRFYGDSVATYTVNLQGLVSDLPMLWGPSFAWHEGIRYIEGFEVSLERIDGLLNSTAIDLVLGFVEYRVPRVILEVEDGKGDVIFIKPWVDLDDPYGVLAPLVERIVKTYTSPLFAYFDPNRFYVNNPRLLMRNFVIGAGLALSFTAKARGRIVGLSGFEDSPYYLVFGSKSISFNGESGVVLFVDHVVGSRVGVVFLPLMLHLNTVPSPRVDKTLCMDLIDSVCLYLDNVSRIIFDMRSKTTVMYLARTSLFHSQLSTYTVNYPGVLPYMAIAVGYTPKNTFTLYPIYPAIRIENISRIKVVELEGYPVRTAVNFTVEYPNNMTSNIVVEPYFMIPLSLRIYTHSTVLTGFSSLNKTYTYRIEDYEYSLRLTSTSWYPYTYLSSVRVEFPGRRDIDDALIVVACGSGVCGVNVTNNTITIIKSNKVRIMFFIKGERKAIVELLNRHVRVIDYYGVHRLNYPGIMSSYILPNNTSIVFGWTLLLPPRNNSVKIVFSSVNTTVKVSGVEKISKPIIPSEDTETEENNYFGALLILFVIIASIVLYILLKPR